MIDSKPTVFFPPVSQSICVEATNEKYQHVVIGTKRSDPQPFNLFMHVSIQR